ncbi:Hypothetical protein NTJ_11827 [Nesidiocoris tenuis]|uniref:Uncharacterized protein n=1 Tax=Nesidiocoris tenuis TaxID=355587 RepID=A0ABN7B3L5_9HEMI|nr:Hypothetical protein NTJ_11827 [Nesidiocoris tenuis]
MKKSREGEAVEGAKGARRVNKCAPTSKSGVEREFENRTAPTSVDTRDRFNYNMWNPLLYGPECLVEYQSVDPTATEIVGAVRWQIGGTKMRR